MQKKSSKNSSPQSEEESNNDRIDEVSNYYRDVIKCEEFSSWFFGSAFLCALLMLIPPIVIGNVINQSLKIVYMIVVISNTILTLLSRFYYQPIAEEKRRKQLISNAFSVSLISEITNKYYNNNLPPSIKRLSANVMENAFFSKTICAKMFKVQSLIVIGWLLIWVAFTVLRNTGLEFILTITQTVFSIDLLNRCCALYFLKIKHEEVYLKLYNIFLTNQDLISTENYPMLLSILIDYEVAKGTASILQNTKYFNELNPVLTEKWDGIKSTLKIE